MGTEEAVHQLIFSNALTREFLNETFIELRDSLLMPTALRLAEEIVSKNLHYKTARMACFPSEIPIRFM
jgi:hypothetical protein